MHYTKGRLLIDGGEGYIYEVSENPGLLMKVYKETDSLGEPVVTPELFRKLSFMVANQPAVLIEKGIIAWPLKTVGWDTGAAPSPHITMQEPFFPRPTPGLAGFIMPRLDIDEHLQRVYSYRHPQLDSEEYARFPSVRSRISIAVNLCSALHELHRTGYVVGDFNHRNIGVSYSTGQIYFVDCDSFHITDDDGSVYRSNVIMAGYLAPEIIRHCNMERASGRYYNLDKVSLPTFTKESDLFCLAIHIFKLLMNGVDPFRGIKSDATGSTASPFMGNDAIERDAYVFRAGNKPSAVFCPPMESVPPELFSLFDKAFIQGRTDPGARPDAGTWYHALTRYLTNDLIQCPTDAKHQHYRQLQQCPYCAADHRHLAAQGGGYPPASHAGQVYASGEAARRHHAIYGQQPAPGQQASPGQQFGAAGQSAIAQHPATAGGQLASGRKSTAIGVFAFFMVVIIVIAVTMAFLGEYGGAPEQDTGDNTALEEPQQPDDITGNPIGGVISPDETAGSQNTGVPDDAPPDSGSPAPVDEPQQIQEPAVSTITIRGAEYSTDLTELNLSDMDLTDPEIEPLRHMTNLSILELGNNLISDISALSGLTGLSVLYLSGNQITDISGLAGLTDLEYLFLCGNGISNIAALSRMEKLVDIHLENNQIEDINALGGKPNLLSLRLENNLITNINALSGLGNLMHLFLQSNQISDITALGALTGLEVLYLCGNRIGSIYALSGLSNLTEMHLENNLISDVSPLYGLRNLEFLSIIINNHLSDAQINDLRATLAYCQIE